MPDLRPKRVLIAAVSLACAAGLVLAVFHGGPKKSSPAALRHSLLAGMMSANADPSRPKAFVWSATHLGSTLKLRGFVPSEDDRRTVLGMVKAHFPDLEVEDRLKVASGAPQTEQWLGAVSFGLKQLTYLKQGSVRLLNTGLKIEGEARSSEDFGEVKKDLAGQMPDGMTLLNQNVRPPMADPFEFSASLDPNKLTLLGKIPSEDQRKQVKDLARRLFERPALDDKLDLASGAPKNWRSAVEASLRALSRLDSGKVSLSGQALSIEGIAADKVTASDVALQLKRDLPSAFSASANIRWKQADLSHNVELLTPRGDGLTTGTVTDSPR